METCLKYLIHSFLRVMPTFILWQILCLLGLKKVVILTEEMGELVQAKNTAVFPFISASARQLSPFWRVDIES